MRRTTPLQWGALLESLRSRKSGRAPKAPRELSLVVARPVGQLGLDALVLRRVGLPVLSCRTV